MGCFVLGVRNGMGCFVLGVRNGIECFVRGDKNSMRCFVRGGKFLWDVLSGVSKNGMGCFVRLLNLELPFPSKETPFYILFAIGVNLQEKNSKRISQYSIHVNRWCGP